MKRRGIARSAFFKLRASTAILFCAGAACSVLSATLLAFFHQEASSKISQRTLSFSERVPYQRAIEDVYWRHRILPNERRDPKPSLDSVMSQAQMETKVGDYLRDSQALEADWHRPITAEQLQAEMDRMAQHTNQSEVLREVFAALGNDPFVIAECLARPVLAEGLLRKIHDDYKEPLDSRRGSAENQKRKPVAAVTGSYTLPIISTGPNGCVEDTWIATSTTNAPSARAGHTAVWTGSEMIVWGGGASGPRQSIGKRDDSQEAPAKLIYSAPKTIPVVPLKLILDSRRVRYPWAMAPTINKRKLVATAMATFVSTDKFIIFPSIMAAIPMTPVFEFSLCCR